MILANHGATRAHIIVADEASAATWHAARTLSGYLSEMTGASLTIHPASRGTIGNQDAAEICVGQTGRAGEPELTGLKNDGYILKTVGNRLFILGENDRAVLHAVYAFLEDVLGCRFFTDTVEHVPQRAYLAIGEVDKKVISPFEYREVFGNVCYDDDEFASKRGLNGLNGMGLTQDAEHGGSIRYWGFGHTFNALVPVEEFFDEHPEYFSMIDGKRVSGREGNNRYLDMNLVGTQLCLTNPDVIRIVTERIRKSIQDHPECRIFSISQNDCGNYCTCPECARVDAEEGAHSGSLLRLVNAVANDIAEDYPDVIIDTFAYQYTRKPPKLTRPAPNVCVRICSIECCFSHPLAECDHQYEKPTYSYTGMAGEQEEYDPDHTSFQSDLEGWGKICRRMYVWNYNTDFKHYLNPFPNLHVLQKNIQYFLKNGVTGIFEQGNGEDLSGEFGELRYYIQSKLLWEPDGDVDRWMREFMAAYYGMAAQPIREFIDALRNHVAEHDVHVRIYDAPDRGHMPQWLIDLADAKFDEAEALADDAEVLERVRRSRMQIKYCKLFNMSMDDPQRTVACEEFISEIKHFGFTRTREWQPLETSFENIRKGTFE